jgi:hypothetical protein
MSRFKRKLSIPESNPVLTRSGILFSFIDAAGGSITWYVKIGSQPNFTVYTIPTAASVVCGSFMFMQNFDASSKAGQGIILSKKGDYTVDWFTTLTTTGRLGTNVSALII